MSRLAPPDTIEPRLPESFATEGRDSRAEPAVPPPDDFLPGKAGKAKARPAAAPVGLPEPEALPELDALPKLDARPRLDALPDPELPHAAEPLLGDPDAPPRKSSAPSAAIEIPASPRRVGWLGALAVLVILAAGIGAFLAVWMTAPERPVAGIDLGEIADRVRDRLADWGWLAR